MPESLQAKLALARKRWRALHALRGAAAVIAVLAILSLLSFYHDRLVVLSSAGRWGWLLALTGGLIASLFHFVARPLRRPLADEEIATEVERAFPVLKERLLTTVELAHAGAGAGVSTAMIAALGTETERLAGPLNFAHAVPTSATRRTGTFACAACALFLFQLLLTPDAMRSWFLRILLPFADIPIFAYTKVQVYPGDVVVPRGEDVDVLVRTSGVLPDRARLHYKSETSRWMQADLTPVPASDGNPENAVAARRFRFKFSDVQQNITYYAVANDGRANPHTIHVEDRPAILRVRVSLRYPAYTRRPPETIEATAGNIVAPVGTQADVEATASKPLSRVTMVAEGWGPAEWAVEGETARGRIAVVRDQNYSLKLVDRNGFEAVPPPEYTIRAQADRIPEVQIVKPGVDLECAPIASLSLRVTAKDDYGIETLKLGYRVGKRANALPLPVAQPSTPGVVDSAARWNLAPLQLKPGDTLVYEALATDGDTVSGPHTGRSALYRVHIISVEEMRERLEAQMAQEREALRQLIEQQKEAQRLLERARRAANRPEEMHRAEAAERALAQDTAELARRMRQTTEQLRQNNLGAVSQMQRREEAQRNLEELARRAMPAAADAVQRGQWSEAARQEQAIREELERLAQQIAPAPTASQLAQEAERLAQEQQWLAEQSANFAEQTGRKSPQQMSAQERAQLNAMARKQAQLRQQTQALQEQIAQVAREAQERGQNNAADLQRAAQQVRDSGVVQKQTGAQQNLQSGKPSEASPQQTEAAHDLQKLAESLDQAGQKQDDGAQEKRAQQLEDIAEQLRKMAMEQTQIARQTQRGPDPDMSRQLAEQERRLQQQSQQIARRLGGLPQARQSLNSAARNLEQSASQLSQARPHSAVSPAREATRQLLQAAQEVTAMAQTMLQQQEATQLQRTVEQLARDQRALHRQTQQLESARKGGLSPEQQRRAQDLAQRQAGLAQRGKELLGTMPSAGFQWAMGEANRRMDNAARGLGQRNTGEDTQRQQENAAQTLERIARALGQQAQGAQQQVESGGAQSGGEQQMAQASGELSLAREMEAQIRQETGSLERRRSRNPRRDLTAEQQRELNYLTQAQRETQRITERAAQQLRNAPDISRGVQRAAEEMEEVEDMLRESNTGRQTQGQQDQIVRRLDQALRQTRQAMRQQRQQMAQQRQQQGESTGQQQAQQNPMRGKQPASRTTAPVVQAQMGALNRPDPRGRGFGALSPRAQQSLREGQQERVPAEYRDLVYQYYKALSERGK